MVSRMTIHRFYPLNLSLRALSRELAVTDHAVPSLLRKRIEIARGIDTLQAELANMLSDLNALDCAIRLYDPDIELPEIIMQPVPRATAQDGPDIDHSAGDPPHGIGADADRG